MQPMRLKFRELSDVMIMLGGFCTGVSCALSVRLHRHVDDWPFWPPLMLAILAYLLHLFFRWRERHIVVQVRSSTTVIAIEKDHTFDCTWHSTRVCNCK